MQVISKAFATEYDNIKEVTAEMIWPCFIVPTLCAASARLFNLPRAKRRQPVLRLINCAVAASAEPVLGSSLCVCRNTGLLHGLARHHLANEG